MAKLTVVPSARLPRSTGTGMWDRDGAGLSQYGGGSSAQPLLLAALSGPRIAAAEVAQLFPQLYGGWAQIDALDELD